MDKVHKNLCLIAIVTNDRQELLHSLEVECCKGLNIEKD